MAGALPNWISYLWERINKGGKCGFFWSWSLRGCSEPASQARGLAWILEPGEWLSNTFKHTIPTIWTNYAVASILTLNFEESPGKQRRSQQSAYGQCAVPALCETTERGCCPQTAQRFTDSSCFFTDSFSWVTAISTISTKRRMSLREQRIFFLSDIVGGPEMKVPVSAPPVETQFAQKLAANDKKDRCQL